MASQLLYLGILFTMTLGCLCAQEADENEDPKIDPGLSLIPAPYVVLVQQKMKTPVLLNCSLNVTDPSLTPLTYKWLKDGQQIDLIHPKPKIQLLPNGSLLLQPRRSKSRNRTLDGVYDCLVTTATKDVVIARRVKVVVASIAKNFSKEPTSKEAYKSGVARFECNIRAEPVASYIWHRNDTQLLQDDDRFTSLLSGVLQITDIQLSDAGLYWCQATTYLFTSQEQIANFGWKKGKRAELKVKADSSARQPILLASPQNISVLVGQTAEFECFADGNPLPTVTWRKIDSDAGIGLKKVSRHGNLRLTQVTAEDAGVYECTVSGRTRTLKASATLTVLEPPKLEQGPDSYSYPVSRGYTTSCKVTGNPPPKISWYHNGVPLSRADLSSETRDVKNGQTLYVYTLQKKHSGIYQCVAQNSVGQVMAIALVKVYKKPEAPLPPSNVQCSPLSSSSFLVTWDHMTSEALPYIVAHQIVGDTKPPIQTFCPAQVNVTKQKCEIINLIPFTNYSVIVQAFVHKGASDASEKVYVRTLEDVPKGIPSLSVSSPHFHSMLVSWTPLPIEQSRGHVTTYKVYYRSADKRDETSKEISGNQTSYLITGVEPEKTYEVLVIAATSAGYSKDQWPWTKYTTPPANASSPPRLDIKYINATAVWLEWQAPTSSSTLSADQAITGYNLELRSRSKASEPTKNITLGASVWSHIFSDLDYEQFYEVTLVALTNEGASSPSTSVFQLKELQSQLVPDNVHADSEQSHSVSLSWTPVPGINVEYEVCFCKELDKSEKLCKISKDTNLTVSDLDSFTRYEFVVRAVIDGVRGADSKNLIVQTTEDKPSPPLNLTVKVKQNSVQLQWLPPAKPNGVIMHYIITYAKDAVTTADITWKSITKKGTDTYAQVDDLESGRYLFKLTAGNTAGLSPYTDVVMAVPICKTHIETSCSLATETTKDSVDVTGTPNEPGSSKLTNLQIGLIVGCLVGLICMVLLVMVVRHFCHRNYAREQDPNTSQSPIYRGNGHVSPVPGHHKPGNGHVHHISNSPAGYRHEAINMHESTPMLIQIPENEHSDSKGRPDHIMPNGFLPNGIVKDSHKTVGQTQHSLPSGEIKSSNNSEELQGLMAAMFASMDRRNILGDSVRERIPMSTLDDIDKSHDYLGDNTSQDSGMGGRHAGMLGSKDMIPPDGPSPASSPGDSSLGRDQQNWDMGREVDEIGGVFIDRSTGAVIGEVLPRSKAIEKEEIRDEYVVRGKSSEDNTSNDRDSGHGSEVKSHGEVLSCTGDDANPSFTIGLKQPLGISSTEEQQEEMFLDVLPPPPPLPPPLLISSSTAHSSSPTASSQQLPCSNNRNLSNNSRPQNSLRQQQRSGRQNISQRDLPPPPPSPPLPSLSLPPCQRFLAADTAAAETAELITSGSSIDDRGQQQLNDGSILSRQSEGDILVGFSPAPPAPSPPHIA